MEPALIEFIKFLFASFVIVNFSLFLWEGLAAVRKARKTPEYQKDATIEDVKKFVEAFKRVIDEEMSIKFHATFLKMKLDDSAEDLIKEMQAKLDQKQKPEDS